MDHSDLGARMKSYENCYRLYLPKRQAVIIRIDGKAFHSFTRGFERPYDALFADCMRKTAERLCENISGCVFGYTQSDEISLVLVDYKNINTEPWFGNNLQKLVSVSASMATFFFGDEFRDMLSKSFHNKNVTSEQLRIYYDAYSKKMPLFDSRVFILPREEVVNYLYWRQLDCVRNSIQLAGQAFFSQKQLQGKNCNEIQEMLRKNFGVIWADYPTWFKNGTSIYKIPCEIYHKNDDGSQSSVMREKWIIDLKTPIFSQKPELINEKVIFKE